MRSLEISIPDELADFAKREAGRRGFDGVDEFVHTLIRDLMRESRETKMQMKKPVSLLTMASRARRHITNKERKQLREDVAACGAGDLHRSSREE